MSSDFADSATSKWMLAGAPDDGGAGEPFGSGLGGDIRDSPLDDPRGLAEPSLPLKASDSDSPSEPPKLDAASLSFPSRPRAETRAGMACTFLVVPPSADAPSADEVVKVSGVEADPLCDGGDAIAARRGEEWDTKPTASYS